MIIFLSILVQLKNFLYNKPNMTKEKKEKNTIYITHSGELLIWLIVILVVIAFSTFSYMNKIKDDNTFSIYMPDVDGLIVGSPVRMMGIEVGHITKIKPTNEEVFVKFIITDNSIQLPQGTVATVEFSGMAGSKSLELYLPNKDTYINNDVPILAVNPPKRLHDAMGLLNEMFDKLNAIFYTSTSFGGKVKDLELPTGNGQDAGEFLDFADQMVNDANKKANDLGKKLNGVNDNGKK